MSSWLTSTGRCGLVRLAALAVAASGSASLALGQEDGKTTGGFELDLNSRYVFRGLAFSQGAVVNPSAFVSRGPWTLSVWGNFVAREKVNHGKLNEVDAVLSCSTTWHELEIEPSLTYYGLLNQPGSESTGELAVRVGLPLGRGLEAFTNQAIDVVEYHQAWVGELGIGGEWQPWPRVGLGATLKLAGASRGFHQAYAGVTSGGWSYVGLEVEARIELAATFYLRPHLSLTSLRGRRLRAGVDDPDLVEGGIAAGASF